jgi:hypothetical protein
MFESRRPSSCGRWRRTTVIAATLLVTLAGLSGCETPSRLGPPPEALATQSQAIPGPTRFLVARDVTAFRAEAERSREKEIAWRRSHGETGALPPMSMLAISGGGDGGAFGAGLMAGWTASGTRPEFKVVTGVRTGALIAPFAFLGPQDDPILKQVFTQVSSKDIFRRRGLLRGMFADALSDTTPLFQLVERHVDRQMLDQIAAEYAKGRLLLIGTTNLDIGEPVIWNMTAIAASPDPKALDLFRRILIASSAIPGVFPPVLIDVDADGAHYQEMHVDGGAMSQVFLYPPGLTASDPGVPQRQRTAYIIRNDKLEPEWENVRRRTLPIAARAISSLMQTQGIGDLYRIYLTTQRDGVDFNLTSIPASFNTPHTTQFDTTYMRSLYQTGYDLAAKGVPWAKVPPRYVERPGE